MIQRVQSLFLALAIALMLSSAIYFPIWKTAIDNCTYLISSLYATKTCGSVVDQSQFIGYIFMLELLFSGICLVSLVSYKNRRKQLMLGGINSIVGSACLVCMIFFTNTWVKELGGPYGLGFHLPLVSIFLNILANRFIRKDEKLVKSLDSIR